MLTLNRRHMLVLTMGALVTASAHAADLKAIKIALVPQTFNIAIAERKGFFAKHGLKTETIALATGTETIAAVKAAAPISLWRHVCGVNAIHNGFDLKLVAGANHTSSAVNYLVRNDSDIKTVADLKGRTIGLGGVPFFRVFAYKFLAEMAHCKGCEIQHRQAGSGLAGGAAEWRGGRNPDPRFPGALP